MIYCSNDSLDSCANFTRDNKKIITLLSFACAFDQTRQHFDFTLKIIYKHNC